MLMFVIGFIVYIGSAALGVQIFGEGRSAAYFGLIVGSIGFYSVVYLVNKSDKK